MLLLLSSCPTEIYGQLRTHTYCIIGNLWLKKYSHLWNDKLYRLTAQLINIFDWISDVHNINTFDVWLRKCCLTEYNFPKTLIIKFEFLVFCSFLQYWETLKFLSMVLTNMLQRDIRLKNKKFLEVHNNNNNNTHVFYFVKLIPCI